MARSDNSPMPCDDAGLGSVAEEADAQEVAVHLGLGGEEAERKLLAAHLEADDGGYGALPRRVPSDVHSEGRLAERRAVRRG